MDEKEYVCALRNPEGEDVKLFAIDLLTEQYDVRKLIAVAREHGVVQQLGYLAEVTSQAAKAMGIERPQQLQLEMLLNELTRDQFTEWCYLSPHLPQWGKDLIASGIQTEQNKRWRIYAHLTQADIADWIDLYVVRENASAPRR